MKTLKKLAATLTLAGIIIIGVTNNANAGMLLSDFTGGSDTPAPCEERADTKVDSGIIVSLRGIIVSFTGIIVSYGDVEQKPETRTDCGIIVS